MEEDNNIAISGFLQVMSFSIIAYAPLFNIDASGSQSGTPGGSFLLYHLIHSFAVLKVAPPIHVLYRVMEKAGLAAGAVSAVDLLGIVLGLVRSFYYRKILPRQKNCIWRGSTLCLRICAHGVLPVVPDK